MAMSKISYYFDRLIDLKLNRTLQLVWKLEPRRTVGVIVMILISIGFLYLSLITLKDLIDLVSQFEAASEDYERLIIQQVLIAGGAMVARSVVASISDYFTEVQASIVSEKIDNLIHRHTVDLDMAYYEDPEYFNTLKLAKEAGGGRPNAVLMGLIEIFSSCLRTIAASMIIVSIDWRLLPLLVLFIFPMFWVRIHFSDKQNALRIKNTPLERKAGYFGQLITSEVSAREIRSYNLGDYFKNKYFAIRTRLMGERLKISRQRTIAESGFHAIASLGFFACIYFITLGVIDGRVSTGDIGIFLVIFPMIFNYLHSITAGISSVYSNSLYVKYIFELFDLKSQLNEPAEPQPIPTSTHTTLVVDSLSFRYPHDARMVLSGINLEIPSRKVIALVGLNGSGKSTLIKLLTRLYDPTEGAIRMGGTDIREFTLASYRKQVSVVFQDFCKYNVSAAENIFLGDIDRKQHNRTDMERAAVMAGADVYIREFENGYETMMGRIFEGGREVSVGQWQKLATARAFYSPARFLVLDEATSALDAQSEYKLVDTLKANLGDRGALIISHRYSTVKHADYVYVLSAGRIVQEGPPDVLGQINGAYAELFKIDLLEDNMQSSDS